MKYKSSDFKCTFGGVEIDTLGVDTVLTKLPQPRLWHKVLSVGEEVTKIELHTEKYISVVNLHNSSPALDQVLRCAPTVESPFSIELPNNVEVLKCNKTLTDTELNQLKEPMEEMHKGFTEPVIFGTDLDKFSTDDLCKATCGDLDRLASQIGVVRQQSETPRYCQYNDCGWCYYRGDTPTTDVNGACNKIQECEVPDEI